MTVVVECRLVTPRQNVYAGSVVLTELSAGELLLCKVLGVDAIAFIKHEDQTRLKPVRGSVGLGIFEGSLGEG